MAAGTRRGLAGCCAALAALAASAGAGGVPPETGARLERALEVLGTGFVGTYTFTLRAVVEKPGGKDRQESLRVVAVSRGADGASESRIVKALENGADVTEKERAKETRATRTPTPRPEKNGGDRKSASADLRLPTGDDASRYRIGDPVEEGDLLVVAYEPLPEHRKDDGVAKGRLAWRGDTLDPAWLEAELLVLPTGASRLVMRFEFARAGGVLYPRLTTTSGAGGILWIKRNFEARMEISDLAPAPPAAGR